MKRCMITLNDETLAKLGGPRIRMFLGSAEEFRRMGGVRWATLDEEFEPNWPNKRLNMDGAKDRAAS